MSIWGRRIPAGRIGVLAALFIVVVGAARAVTGEPAREITLVARSMAFYLEADGRTANPAIHAAPGERLRIVLRNRDRGMTHDFAVPALDAATDALDWNEDDGVTFEAPSEPGTYEYVCRPHLLMMKGRLVVAVTRR